MDDSLDFPKSFDDAAIDKKSDGKKKWTAEDYANAVMNALKSLQASGFEGQSFTTERIAEACGIPKTSYDTMGKAMMRLRDIGRLERTTLGIKHRWRLIVKTWDIKEPFRLPNYEAPDDTEVEDDDEDGIRLTEKGIQLLEKYATEIAALRAELSETKEHLTEECRKATRTQTIKIEKYDGKTVKINDIRPKQFDRVLSLVKCRRNVLLFGPAGCGKTHLAEMISRAGGFERFGAISLNAGISDVHILGRSTPNLNKGANVYQPSEFVEIFEKGGLFLFDELDAADPNVLLCINTALANGYVNLPNRPDKPKALKHPDFLCMATANTIGKGATRQYVGRSQLDEATLDRFRIGMVECDYDTDVEEVLCPDQKLRTTLQALRKKVTECGLRRVISTRYLRDAYIMVKEGGWTHADVYGQLVGSWPADELAKVSSVIQGGVS